MSVKVESGAGYLEGVPRGPNLEEAWLLQQRLCEQAGEAASERSRDVSALPRVVPPDDLSSDSSSEGGERDLSVAVLREAYDRPFDPASMNIEAYERSLYRAASALGSRGVAVRCVEFARS